MIQRHEGWMFLSHSSKDFELVRQIRNTLEDHGFRPITFFLKCITDSTELDGLIKREIEARRWFVFVDSENSRSSKWAQEELAYARALNKKVYTIDTTRDYFPQLKKILQRTTVFLSYSHRDMEVVTKIRQSLIDNDYQVWWDAEISAGSDWSEEVLKQIENAGFCLLVLTENSINSRVVLEEISYSMRKGRPFIPVLIGDIHLPPGLHMQLSRKQFVSISAAPTSSELNKLIESIIEYQERNDL